MAERDAARSPETGATSRAATKPGAATGRWAALRTLARTATQTLRLVAEVSRSLLALLLALQLTDALVSVSIAWVGKHLIDAVVAASQGRAPRGLVLRWVGLELGLVLAASAIEQLQSYLGVRLRGALGLRVNVAILEKANDVSFARFEDAEFNNQMTQARREASARPLDVVNQLLGALRQGVTLLGYTTLLWSLGPWSLLLLAAAAVPVFLGEAYFGRRAFALQGARTQRNRRAFYLESVLTTDATVKEVKLFALGPWLRRWYEEIYAGFHREELGLSRERLRVMFALRVLPTLALYSAYATVALRAASGAITLGAMTLYVTVFRAGQTALAGVLSSLARVYEANLYMSNLFGFLAVESDEPGEEIPEALRPESAPPRVVFDEVSFTYPGLERPVLDRVSFTLEPGETVALVGSNGAGKTTLVKLLVGLYRPSAGRILVDGVDVRTMSPSVLRRRVGVVFQDFAKFQFSAGDNVGLGWLPRRSDGDELARAVRDAGADEVIARLPKGLETPLGRAFGGDDLSIGQWQRVALARAFMRHGGLLVLDEPTASLDPEAEQLVFERFRALKQGRTALLITHRFGSVRMADRIIVLERGRVLEEGTHAALIAQNGRYAALFNAQASGYTTAPGGGALEARATSAESRQASE